MQLATLLIGLISATALWSGVQALNQQARTSYDRAAATFGGTRTAMLVGRDVQPSRNNSSSTCAAPAGRYRRRSKAASRSADARSACSASSR